MALFWAIRSEYPYTDKSAQARYYQAQCNKSAAAGYVPFDRDIIAAKRELESAEYYRKPDKKADYPDYCDLAAQYRAASAAESSSYGSWVAAALTLIGVIFLWRTLIYTKGALREAAETVEIARTSSRKELRAYVFADTCSWSKKDKTVEIKFRNSGTVPAGSVKSNAQVSANGEVITWGIHFIGAIFPNHFRNLTVKIPDAALEKIQTDVTFRIYGEIIYDDGFEPR